MSRKTWCATSPSPRAWSITRSAPWTKSGPACGWSSGCAIGRKRRNEMAAANLMSHRLRAGMVGLGMIFDETYRPLFQQLRAEGLYRRDFGFVDVELAAVASRTGARADGIR